MITAEHSTETRGNIFTRKIDMLVAGTLILFSSFCCWSKALNVVEILPQNDVIYKIDDDIKHENWHFGFILHNPSATLTSLQLKHFANAQLIQSTLYSQETLSAYLAAAQHDEIKSKGFHIVLPASAKADELQLIFSLSDKSVLQRTVTLKRYKQHNRYRLPLNGTWFVSSGYDFGVEHRRHLSRGHFAFDLIKVDANGQRNKGSTLNDNFAFAQPVFSPAAGTVIAVHNSEKDGPPGKRIGPANYVEIDHGFNEVSRFVHLRSGSIKVAVGDKVEAGQLIAEVGKSGTKTVHLHMGFQRNIIAKDGSKKSIPIPVLFSDYSVSWNQGSNVKMDLGRPRRGQFIRNLIDYQ